MLDGEKTSEFNAPFITQSLWDEVIEFHSCILQNKLRNRFGEGAILVNSIESADPTAFTLFSFEL